MKTLFVVFLSALIGIAFVTSVFAQYPSLTKRAMDSMERNREATAEGSAYYRGEVTTVDVAAKTLTVKGKKGDMTFDVTDVKMKGEPKPGHKVMVRYMEKDGKMVATSVLREGVKKLSKKEVVPVPTAPASAK